MFLEKLRARRQRRVIEKLHNASTHKHVPEQQTNQKSDKQQSWFMRDRWALVGSIILATGLVYYGLFFTRWFTITTITVTGNTFISGNEVQSTVSQWLSQRWLYVIPKNTYWSANSRKIEQLIWDQFGKQYAFVDIHVTFTYPHQLSITINERTPSVTWVTAPSETETHVYTVDRSGVITQSLKSLEDTNKSYPMIRNKNRKTIPTGTTVARGEYIDDILAIHDTLESTTGLQPVEYIVPQAECSQQQYVAEKIFEKEISESEGEDIRQKKREIQERLQKGEITVDESLQELEKVKQSAGETDGDLNSNVNIKTQKNNNVNKIEWEQKEVRVDCDLVEVTRDVYAHVQDGKNNQFDLYIDTNQDINSQLKHVKQLLDHVTIDHSQIHYIDVRIPDRAYYK